MIANRIYKKLNVGEDQERHVVRLESMLCAPNGVESYVLRGEMIRQIVATPEALNCGPVPFQKMAMFHDGQCWVIEVQATIDKPTT